MNEHLELALQIVGTLSVIASATPTPKDDGILFVLKQILNFCAGNFGFAKNAADRDVEQAVEDIKGRGTKAGVKKLTEVLVRKQR